MAGLGCFCEQALAFLHSPKQHKIELEQLLANHHEEYVFISFKSFLEDLRGQSISVTTH